MAFNLGGFFGGESSKSKTEQDFWTQQQKEVADIFGKFLAPKIGTGLPKYEGSFVAPMSGYEKAGLSNLGQYIGADSPETFDWAKTGVKGALDPAATDELYERIKRRTLEKDLPDLQDAIARNANLSGMYFSGPHQHEQFRLVGDVSERLLDTLAQMKTEDRERALRAAPIAMSLAREEEEGPLRKAMAGLELGGLPRSLEQARMTADFEEFLRTQAETNPILAQVLAYLSKQGMMTGTTSGAGTSWGLKGGLDLK